MELVEVLNRVGTNVITVAAISHDEVHWIDMCEAYIPQLQYSTVHDVEKGVHDHSILKCTCVRVLELLVPPLRLIGVELHPVPPLQIIGVGLHSLYEGDGKPLELLQKSTP